MSTAKKITITAVGIAITLVTSVMFLIFWRGSPNEILSVANNFQPPSSWKLESEMVRPPAFTCLDGGTCPEVTRLWVTDKKVSHEELKKILQTSNLDLTIEGDCLPPKDSLGRANYLCDASGTIADFNVHVWLVEDSAANRQKISLDVRPR